jgi:TRAP-type C4-dicarboxylate transport system substrate-binding protein
MRKNIVLVFFAVFFFLFSLNTVFAQRGSNRSEVINIRFASPLPRSSDWGRALDRMAADWEKATNNGVRVIVNHDGREGSEHKMISSLSSDAIQVALFTSTGIADICPAIMNLSVPFMIRNDRELDLVLQSILPELERRVRNEFVILAWSRGGWVYIFSKEMVLTPDDLKRQRLGTITGMDDLNTVFRTMGFQLVETDFTTVGTRLASNMINSIYVIPALIAPMQLHRNLGHMLEMPIAPVMGAIVMNRVTWNKLTPAQQQEMIRATQRIAVDFDASVSRTEANAISAMGRDGLRVNRPSQTQIELWSRDLQTAMPSLVGPIFDRDLYSRINTILERARSGR